MTVFEKRLSFLQFVTGFCALKRSLRTASTQTENMWNKFPNMVGNKEICSFAMQPGRVWNEEIKDYSEPVSRHYQVQEPLSLVKNMHLRRIRFSCSNMCWAQLGTVFEPIWTFMALKTQKRNCFAAVLWSDSAFWSDFLWQCDNKHLFNYQNICYSLLWFWKSE